MRRLQLGLLLVLIAASPIQAARAADPGELETLRARSATAGVPGSVLASVEKELEQARSAGLPTAMIQNKFLEGIAKGVPPARVLIVVRTLRVRLARGAKLLGPLADPPSARAVAGVAEALGRGVAPEDIGTLTTRASRGGARAEVVAGGALAIAGLREAGVYDPAIVVTIGDAVEWGYSEKDLARLVDDLSRFAANGGNLANFSIGDEAANERTAGGGSAETDGEGAEDGRLTDEREGSSGSGVPGNEELGGNSEGEGSDDPLAGDRPGRGQDSNNPDSPKP